MAELKKAKYLQDLPPKGGFPEISWERFVPRRGPSGVAFFLGASLMMWYGFTKVGQINKERRLLKEERTQARLHLMPLLQAEEDRLYLKIDQQRIQEEAKIMKDVEHWNVGEQPFVTTWGPRYVFSELSRLSPYKH